MRCFPASGFITLHSRVRLTSFDSLWSQRQYLYAFPRYYFQSHPRWELGLVAVMILTCFDLREVIGCMNLILTAVHRDAKSNEILWFLLFSEKLVRACGRSILNCFGVGMRNIRVPWCGALLWSRSAVPLMSVRWLTWPQVRALNRRSWKERVVDKTGGGGGLFDLDYGDNCRIIIRTRRADALLKSATYTTSERSVLFRSCKATTWSPRL